MKKKAGLLATLILCFAFYTLLAQAQEASLQSSALQPYLKKFTSEQGLSQNTVTAIAQDSTGFMWIGTRSGLNRYDGYQFVNYNYIPGDSSSLFGQHINCLLAGPSGNLWVGTEKGISVLEPSSHLFRNFGLNTENSSQNVEPHCFSVGPRQHIWVGTNKGLFIVNDNGGLSRPSHPIFRTPEIKNLYVRRMFTDSRGRIWLGTASEGAYVMDTVKGFIRHFFTDTTSASHKLGNNRVEAFTEDAKGNIWIGTYGGGVYQCDQELKIIRSFIRSGPENGVRALARDQEGFIWAGTFNGAYIISPENGTVRHISYSSRENSGLNHPSVRALFCDKRGAIWIGTYLGGLNLYNPGLQRFHHFSHSPFNSQSLAYNIVTAINGNEQDIWIGTDNGYLHRLLKNNTLERFLPADKAGIKSVYADKNGYVWFSAFKKGLYRWRPGGGRAELLRIPDNSGSFYDNPVINHIFSDSRGRIWLATDRQGGVHVYDPLNKTFPKLAVVDSLNKLLSFASVKFIMEDQLGNFWLATHNKGLVQFNEQSGKIITYSTDKIGPGKEVNSLLEDRNGNIWIGTNGEGLYQFDRMRQQFNRYSSENGLLNNTIFGITADKEGNIWIGSFSGLSCLDPRSGEIRNYTNDNGFPLAEINENSFFQQKDGTCYFGGLNGMARFRPEELQPDPYLPKPVITKFLLYNKEVFPGDASGLLQQTISKTSHITLMHHQSIFSLEFASLNFQGTANQQYAYRLKGLEEEWNLVGDRRSAAYSNLRDGDYVFQVKCTNSDGKWGQDITEIQLSILPPFWRSNWAFLGYAFLLAAGLLIFRKYSLNTERLKHQIEIQQVQQTQQQQIHQHKLQFFTDISHEIRTPLGLIQAPLDKLLRNSLPSQQHALELIQYNLQRLILLMNQLMNMQEIEAGKYKLNYSNTSIQDLVRKVIEAFRPLAEEHHKNIAFEDESGTAFIRFDKEKMEQILFNLLSNAFKFTPEHGMVSVRLHPVKKTADKLLISISDNGPGISPEHLPFIFDRFYKIGSHKGSGIGLALTRALVELHGGSIEVSSSPGLGTQFLLGFPLASKNEHDLSVAPGLDADVWVPAEYRSLAMPQATKIVQADQPENPALPLLLLIDDHAELLVMMKEYLSSSYRVLTAENALKALQMMEKETPDLIVSDIMMPEMNGQQLCAILRAADAWKHIPLILLTAHADTETKMASLRAGANDFMTKPFPLQELEIRIENLLTARNIIREKFTGSIRLSPNQPVIEPENARQLTLMKQIMEDNMADSDFGVEELSQKMNMSRVHLYRKLTSLTGKTPQQFIKEMRLERAAQLLTDKDKRIAEVAYEVGFADQAYFAKAFKKMYGVSPTEYKISPQDPLIIT